MSRPDQFMSLDFAAKRCTELAILALDESFHALLSCRSVQGSGWLLEPKVNLCLDQVKAAVPDQISDMLGTPYSVNIWHCIMLASDTAQSLLVCSLS